MGFGGGLRSLHPPVSQVWKKSIFAGTQRIAVHELTTSSDVVYTLLADYLGSTTTTLRADGSMLP